MEADQEIIKILKQVVGERESFLPLHEPFFGKEEEELVKDCITSGWVSSVGKYVDQLEVNLAAFCGVKRAIAVVNGTAALHICLLLAGVEPGDEVIMPALTFVASANAATMANAVPHFVDIEEATLGLDPVKLREYLIEISESKNGKIFNKKTGKRISAIVPMHTLGHPVRMKAVSYTHLTLPTKRIV